MGEGLLQVLLLVFFKGRIRRERIDGEVAVGGRFMNNDGYGENCPDVRLKNMLLTSESGWVGEEIQRQVGEKFASSDKACGGREKRWFHYYCWGAREGEGEEEDSGL